MSYVIGNIFKIMFIMFLFTNYIYANDFSLRKTVETVLQNSLDIKKRKTEEDIAFSKIQTAGGAFDFNLAFNVGGGRDYYEFDNIGPYDSIFYGFRFEEKTKIGLSYTGELKATHSFQEISGSLVKTHRPYGRLNLKMPLLKSWSPKLNASKQVSAEVEYEVSKLETMGEIESILFSVTILYLQIVSLKEQLNLIKETETRTEKMVKEYKVLVDRDNISVNDLNIIKAQLSSVVVERIDLEQEIQSKKNELLNYSETFPDDITLTTELPFPEKEYEKECSVMKNSLVERALGGKWQLIMKKKKVEAAQFLKDVTENNKKHDLNLSLDGSAYRDFNKFELDPVFTAYVSLEYVWPIGNNKAEGEYRQSVGSYEKNRIELEIMKRNLVRDISSGVSKLVKTKDKVFARKAEVDLYKIALDGENKKVKLGHSTIFDLIELENKYLAIKRNLILDRYEYVEALISLKKNIGLLSGVRDKVFIDIDNLLSDLEY